MLISGKVLFSSDAQFGFLKDSGCRNAIYTVRKTVDRLEDGSIGLL